MDGCPSLIASFHLCIAQATGKLPFCRRIVVTVYCPRDSRPPEKKSTWEDGIYLAMSYPPGLHEAAVVQPKLSPGSAFAFLGTTVHGAGANSSADVWRRAPVVQYCVGWIRPAHSNHLPYPPDIARNLPETVQRLLGYQLEAKHYGQLEQGVDPITLLRG